MATSARETRSPPALRRRTQPRTIRFADDGTIPNNPTLPLIVYPAVIDLPRFPDPAAVFEALFEANGWGDTWRDGIYDYAHYHSGIHEVLGIARGQARVRFGGDQRPGDFARRRRCRHPARRHRPSAPERQRRLPGRRRLSARRQL